MIGNSSENPAPLSMNNGAELMGAVGALAPTVFLPRPEVVLILAPTLFSPVRRQWSFIYLHSV